MPAINVGAVLVHRHSGVQFHWMYLIVIKRIAGGARQTEISWWALDYQTLSLSN